MHFVLTVSLLQRLLIPCWHVPDLFVLLLLHSIDKICSHFNKLLSSVSSYREHVRCYDTDCFPLRVPVMVRFRSKWLLNSEHVTQ